MDEQRPPSQAVKSYAGGIAARQAQREEARAAQGPVFPNLAEAALTYKPSDGYQTPAQMGEEQRRDAPDPQTRGLSPDTIAGLERLRAEEEAVRAQRPPPEPAPPPPPAPPAAPPTPPKEPDEDPDYDEVDRGFVTALEEAKKDVIANDAERKAVAKRVKPIDLAQGLLTSEFTQVVPVVPEKLVVKFRCLATGENQDLRLMLFERFEEEPRLARIAGELLGFYQTVATVMAINQTNYASHNTFDATTGRTVFQRKIFAEKLAIFERFPLPLIGSLSAHSTWFEQRVRDLFATTETIKNG